MGDSRTGVERVARESYGRLLAYLAPRCGIDTAEDALADAFAAALERWPVDGVPQNPEAWLLTSARNRFIDGVRRQRRETAVLARAGAAAREAQEAFDSACKPEDERLAMLFACAHPAIAPAMHAPLMLQIVLGIDAARIASAFLVAPAAMSQRLVRAKRKIVDAGVPLRVPEAGEFTERLDGVLSAMYAAFSEGWNDPAGVDPRARGLAHEALWLGRLVVDACPGEPEPLGLLSLMLHAHARCPARRDRDGAFVPLDAQDVRRWDRAMIDEAEFALKRAAVHARNGRFQLEAAIQSAHAVRRFGIEPDWRSIVDLYEALYRVTGSPVVALNREIAFARFGDVRDALRSLDERCAERLRAYQPYWAARADLLARSGDRGAAAEAYAKAIGLTVDPAVRDYLSAKRTPLL